MTGLKLVHHEWHPKPSAEKSFDGWGAWRWRGEDLDHTATSHDVPDGMWIMERSQMGWTWLVGVDYADIDTLHIVNENGVGHTYVISDRPFGYVVVECDDDNINWSKTPREPLLTARKRLHYARQVHKGELSHGVPLWENIGYVRAKDNRPGNGWVRLSDLSGAAGVIAEDLIFGYWQFSGHRNQQWYGNDQNSGQLVDVIIAWTADDIEHKEPEVWSMTQEEMRKHLSSATDQNVWIRRGLAFTILRLLPLGVEPVVEQLV